MPSYPPNLDERRRATGPWPTPSAALRLVAAALFAFAACSRPPAPPPGNVVLILVDTLRADHLGVYGYDRPTSPKLDRFAAENVVFTQARSVAPWTNPSIATIFTGRRPGAIWPPVIHREAIRRPLPAALPTLAAKLGGAGLRTLAFVDHPGISQRLFGRGFDTWVDLYRELDAPVFGTTDGDRIVDRIGRHLRELSSQRFFLYVHLIYPHQPYHAPAGYEDLLPPAPAGKQGRRERRVRAYDAEIRYTDDVVSRLIDEIGEAGLRDDTWIVFTSDHGEGFREHGLEEHGNSLFDELLHVPLIIAPPRSAGIAPRRVEESVSLVDLHATVLAMAGLTPENAEGETGRSLLPELTRGSWLPWRRPAERDVLSQHPHSGDVRGAALVRWPWKLIRRDEPGRPPRQLYDLAHDPGELADHSADETARIRELDVALGRLLAADAARLGPPDADQHPEDLDSETLERLRALGYLR